MRISALFTIAVIFPTSVGCRHLASRSGDVNQLVQVWPGTDFHGIAILALLGDDIRISNGGVVEFPTSDEAGFTVQFAIANAFRQDIVFRGYTRQDPSGRSLSLLSRVPGTPPTDRDSPYLWLKGTDTTGTPRPGFRSDAMTWRVGGETLEVVEGGMLKFRRVFVLEFFLREDGMHYIVEYPFECTFRGSNTLQATPVSAGLEVLSRRPGVPEL